MQKVAIAALTTFVLASSAWAEDTYRVEETDDILKRVKESPFSFEASAGFEYDSNVSVIELDRVLAESDFATVLDLGAEYKTEIANGTEVEVGYDFGQDIQFDFSDFNSQTHRGSLELTHDFGDEDIGFSYQFVHSRLDGNGFLNLHRVSPYVSSYVADKAAYLRASYIYTDKQFIGRTDRDADVNAASLDVFYFLNGLTTYFIFGYRYESEDALAPEFDFTANNAKVRFIQRFPLGERKAKFRAGWSYENRDYEFVTPSIGVVRDDVRHKLDASIEVPFNDIFFGELSYGHDINDSNLPSVDFTQDIVEFRIGAEL